MKRFFSWFVPHSSNHYHPHVLRSSGLVVIALIIALIPSFYNGITAGTAQVLGYATDISAGGLNAASNQQRSANGLPALSLNSALSQAATNKAADMFAKNYWAHNAPDGATPWTFIVAAGYSYSAAGENLAKNFLTSSGVVNAWMDSPAHRANVLDSRFVDVGYAVMNGTLLGDEVTLVVAMYGAPPKTVASSPAPAASAPTSSQPVSSAESPSVPSPAPGGSSSNAAEQSAPASESEPATQSQAAPAEQPNSSSPGNGVAAPLTPKAETAKPGDVLGDIVTAPIKAYHQFNWGQKTTLFVTAGALLLFVMSHTLLWRAQRRGYRHIWFRANPLAQATVLGSALIMVLLSGTGVIL